MKKLLLLITGIVLTLSMNAQTNLLTNGDFETGLKAPWKGYNNAIQSDDAYEGTYAGKIIAKDGSLLQTPIILTEGNTYNVSLTAKWPSGVGNVAGIAVVLQSPIPDKVFLGSTDLISTLDWSTTSGHITVPPGFSEVRVVIYKGWSPVCYIDSVSVIDEGAIMPALSVLSDGTILEGTEDGEVISVTMMNDVFAATLTATNWTIADLPAGVSVGSVDRVDDTHANVTLTGNSLDFDKDLNLMLTIGAAEFVTYAEEVTTGMTVLFKAIVEPPPAISLVSDGEILEDFEDGEVISVEMDDDTFVDPLIPANWTGLNLPAGVTIGSLERVNDTAVIVTLAGNTTGDYDIDISNAGFTIAAEEFITWLDPVDVSGITFTAAVEGGEVVVWEETFDAYADGTDLLDTVGGNDHGFKWELLDSAMVYGGVADVHVTHASAWYGDSVDHRFSYMYSPIEVGKTYIYSVTSRTDDGSNNVASVLFSEGGQFKSDNSGSTEWRTREVIVEPWLPEHDTAQAGLYTWGWNVADRHIYIDNMKLVVLTEPKISASDDGEILEGAEDGEIITIILQNDVFEATLDIANWTVANLPAGVTAASIARVDDTHAEITLAGTTSEDYDADITTVSVSAIRDEFVTSNKTLSAEDGITFTAVLEPAAITLADDGDIMEGAEDGEVITVALTLDTFVATLTPANWTVTNLPAGVSVGEVFRVDDVTVEIVLSGNTSGDYDADITDLTVSIAAAELVIWESDINASSGVTFTAVIESGIEELGISGLKVYPNPVNDMLYIDANIEISKIEITNILGASILVLDEVDAGQHGLNTSQWTPGVYLIRITDTEGNRGLRKILK